ILFIATAALIIPPVFHLARNIKSMIELVVRHSPAISGNSIAPMSNLRKALEGIVISIIALLLLFIALPLAIDTQLHETVSPAVFIAAIGIIVFLAWYLNKTVYRAFSEHVQRDLIKERVTVGKDTRAEQSVAADEDLKKREKPLFLEGKDE
ncbi:MAG: hypothetical protein OEV21_07515, partial [Thermoplasmata archaeon]|nr:hypothetical protein [Thermoplasmata archaeon]